MRRKPYAKHLRRVRKICLAFPDAFEKMSHGEATFFAPNGVFAMFSNNHHGDGHMAAYVPAPPGLQEALVEEDPKTYYRPPYVGSSGWVGIELDRVSDEVLEGHVRSAWQIVNDKKKKRVKGSR